MLSAGETSSTPHLNDQLGTVIVGVSRRSLDYCNALPSTSSDVVTDEGTTTLSRILTQFERCISTWCWHFKPVNVRHCERFLTNIFRLQAGWHSARRMNLVAPRYAWFRSRQISIIIGVQCSTCVKTLKC